MRISIARARACAALSLVAALCVVTPRSSGAQAPLPITMLAPTAYLIVSPSGNLVAQVWKDGIVLVGVQTAAATPAIVASLRTVSAAPIRYVLFAAGDSLGGQDDAGWSDRGATLVSHERMRMNAKHVTSALGFSEVLQIYLDGESVHLVHQPPGHTRADFIVHFESRGVLFLGNAFIAHGYPRIEVHEGASIDSLIKEVSPFAEFENVQIVPGRGPLSTVKDVADYRDMLTGIRDRVSALVKEGKSLPDAIAAKPSAQWDAAYGRGGVAPDRFVESVYLSLKH
jgi:glyoxylase-like metal-dependent hydrolase (beta-lactamase superfamily II)